MSRKKKLQKARDKAEIYKRRTVLEDGTVILEGRYVVMPDGTLRDSKYIIEKERNRGRKKESRSTEGTEGEEASSGLQERSVRGDGQ